MRDQYLGYDADGFTAWMKQFLPEARLYQSTSGHKLLVCDHFVNHDTNGPYLANHLFISTDNGKTFEEIQNHGGSSRTSNGEESASYTCELASGKEVLIRLESKVVVLLSELEPDRKIGPSTKYENFILSNTGKVDLAQAKFIPLPEVRQPEYLFRLPDGRIIFVDATKYNYSYETFRCFIGKPGKMEQVEIKVVNRYRDGGSTVIRTPMGTIFSPSSFDQGKKALHADNSASDQELIQQSCTTAVVMEAIPCRNNEAIQTLMGWLM